MNRIVITHRHSYNHLSKEDKKKYGIKEKAPVWKCIWCNEFYYET